MKIIQQIFEPLKDIFIDYSSLIQKYRDPSMFNQVDLAILLISLGVIFIFGVSQRPLTNMLGFSLLAPILISDFRSSILSLNENVFIKPIFDCVEFAHKNPVKTVSILSALSAKISLFTKSTPVIVKTILLMAYYTRTIFPISNILKIELDEFICCVFYFTLAYLVQYSIHFKTLLLFTFHSLIGSIGLVTLIFNLSYLETIKTISFQEIETGPMYIIFGLLMALSLCLQWFIMYIKNRKA